MRFLFFVIFSFEGFRVNVEGYFVVLKEINDVVVVVVLGGGEKFC